MRLKTIDFHVKTRYGDPWNWEWRGDWGLRSHGCERDSFYFDGRDDDICNINGRKSVIPPGRRSGAAHVPGVAETAVKAVHEHGRDYLKVWIVWEKEAEREEIAGSEQLRKKVVVPIWQFGNFWQKDWQINEIPREFVFTRRSFQRLESGKIGKKEL